MKRNSVSAKLFAMLLCVVMVVGCLPLSAFASDWEGDIDLAPEGLNPENPIFLDLIYRWDNEEAQEGLQVMYYITDAEFDPPYFVTYGMPGQYTFSVTGEGDFSVTIDGEEIAAVEGVATKEITLTQGAAFNFAVSAGEGYYIEFLPVETTPPVGADFTCAAELVVNSANTATTLLSRMGDGMYYYLWTATADGVLTLSFNSYDETARYADIVMQIGSYETLAENEDGTMEIEVVAGEEYGFFVVVATADNTASEFSIQANFEETPTGPEVDESLVFYNKAMLLGADIRGIFQVRKMKATSPYESFKVIVEKNGVESELELVATSDKTNYTTYGYALTVPAKEMADVVNARIVGITADGTYYVSNPDTWSIKEGAVALMDTYASKTDEASVNKMKLCANMLNYGAEAQKKFNYNLDNLATNGLKEEYAALIITTTPAMETIAKTDDTGATVPLKDIVFNLDARVQVLPRFTVPKTDSKEIYSAVITQTHVSPDGTVTEYDTVKIDGSDCLKSGATFAVYIDYLAANELRDVMTITLYKDGEVVSATHTFSAESVLSGMMNSYPTLIPALMNFCDCARAVFG